MGSLKYPRDNRAPGTVSEKVGGNSLKTTWKNSGMFVFSKPKKLVIQNILKRYSYCRRLEALGDLDCGFVEISASHSWKMTTHCFMENALVAREALEIYVDI